MTRGLSPAATYQTYPAEKNEELLKRSSIFEELPSKSSSFQQPFSAAFLSSSSQQLFSAAFLSSFSQQLFSAAFLSSSSQQQFSAPVSQHPFLSYHLAVVRGWWSASSLALLSSFSQQLFSAAILSNLFSAIILLWSGVGGQLAAFLSSFSQQPSSAIILLWSGVGGQLVTSSCCSQGLVVKYAPVL